MGSRGPGVCGGIYPLDIEAKKAVKINGIEII